MTPEALAAALRIMNGQRIETIGDALKVMDDADLIARALLAAASLLEDYRREVAINAGIIAEARKHDGRNIAVSAPHAAYCDIAMQDAQIETVDEHGERLWMYDDALFDKSLAGNGWAIVPISETKAAVVEECLESRAEIDALKHDIGRHIVIASDLTAESERLRERVKELEAALRKIANGEGLYGAQAFEYKQVARAVLAAKGGGS